MTQKRSAGASSDRNVVRDARARPSHRTFYIALAVILLLGLGAVGYAMRRGRQDAASATVTWPSDTP